MLGMGSPSTDPVAAIRGTFATLRRLKALALRCFEAFGGAERSAFQTFLQLFLARPQRLQLAGGRQGVVALRVPLRGSGSPAAERGRRAALSEAQEVAAAAAPGGTAATGHAAAGGTKRKAFVMAFLRPQPLHLKESVCILCWAACRCPGELM